MAEIIAVTEQLKGSAGFMVWWSLNGNTGHDPLRTYWHNAGLNEKELPRLPSPEVALRRALVRVPLGNNIFHRQMGPGHWAIVEESSIVVEEGAKGPPAEYKILSTVKLGVGGKLQFEMLAPASYHTHMVAIDSVLRSYYEQELYSYSASDIGGWLGNICVESKGILLRERGGVFFIPRDMVQGFTKRVNAIQTAGKHRIACIYAMHTKEAVDVVLESVVLDAAEQAAEMEKLIEAGEMTSYKAKTRAKKAEEVRKHVEYYETLLGVKCEEIHKRLEDLQATLSMMALASYPTTVGK